GNMNLGFGSAGANGTYTLSGGSFQLNSTNSIVAVANRGTAVINQSGGTFYVKSGANTLTGLLNIGRNVVNGTAAGTVNLSGGTTVFGNNNYVQAALGTYAVDIGGIGSNDVIDAGAGSNTGSITLAGSINVNLLNGFDPAPGSTFDIATADTLTSAALVNGTT